MNSNEYISYGVRILEYHHVFDDTLNIYTEAVKYLMDVILNEWDILKSSNSYMCNRIMEGLIHQTKNNPNPKYDFDERFYKMPSYIRRAAIEDALGNIKSYKSNLENWKNTDEKQRRKKPRSPKIKVCFPTLYNDKSFDQLDHYSARIKAYIRSTWDWVIVHFRKSDIDYLKKHCVTYSRECPTLVKRGKRWMLRFPFKKKQHPLNKAPLEEELILGVDLGINNTCVCTAMKPNGTIQDRRFLHLKRETDSLSHHLGLVKKAQQHGSNTPNKYWTFAKNINEDIARKTASFIANTAIEWKCTRIVMEHLDLKGKRGGSKKQRLQIWKTKRIQQMVTGKAHKEGIRIATVNALNTSTLAFDGSGEVTRDEENHSLCTFQTGKRYHADLNASYNIAARYFIRAICESVPKEIRLSISAKVPKCDKRSTCTLSDLRELYAHVHGVSLIGV